MGVLNNEYFLGYEEIVDIFGWSLHIWTMIWGIILYILGKYFLRQGTGWVFSGVTKVKKIKYLLGMPDIPDVFIG